MTERKASYCTEPPIIEVPAACPRCGSIDRDVQRTVTLPKTPLRVGDVTYPGRVLRKVICRDCGNRYRVNAPLGHPNDATRAAFHARLDGLAADRQAAMQAVDSAHARLDGIDQAIAAVDAQLAALE